MKPTLKFATCILLITAVVFVACKKAIPVNPVVTRPAPTQGINPRLIPIGTLSIPREFVCAATAGSKILFAGGAIQTEPTYVASSRVDIYDTVTQSWSTAELSMPRQALVAVTLGNKIFFTEGFINGSSRVDIYDASTNSWSNAELSVARAGLASSSADSKVVFAGGYTPFGNAIDIYDAASNNWSTATLNEPRTDISAASLGRKIYFSGGLNTQGTGISNKVDIYDALTNAWSTITMSEPRFYHTTIGAGNKIFWAGGYSSFDSNGEVIVNKSVEIYDVSTGSRAYHQLSHSPFTAGIMNNKIIFFTAISGLSFPMDVFDINTQAWSEYTISLPSWTAIGWRQEIVAAGNKTFIVGNNVSGTLYPNQVWKLEF
jgi:hypothetical protein